MQPILASRCIADDEEEPRLRAVQNVICGYVIHEGDDMTMRQVAALVKLADAPKHVTVLAHELNLGNSTTSRIIDVLEKEGYVRRSRLGRNVTVTITQKGFAKVGRLMSKA